MDTERVFIIIYLTIIIGFFIVLTLLVKHNKQHEYHLDDSYDKLLEELYAELTK